VKIAGVGVGSGFPCRVVAEISNNHNGDRDRCGRLIDAATAAGADFIKFQCYSPDELVALRGDGPAPEPWGSQGWTMRSLYEKARTPFDWFPKIKAHCERVGIPWFSSVFGKESLALLESLDCPAYKIAALDNAHDDLLDITFATGKPVIVSGHGDEKISDFNLYCPTGYPTAFADVHLPTCFDGGLYDGLSSHCLAPELPIAAVARGCKLIEMHFMLQEEPSELESNISLTQYGFAEMIRQVRVTETLLA